jgi:hypothetical protein
MGRPETAVQAHASLAYIGPYGSIAVPDRQARFALMRQLHTFLTS